MRISRREFMHAAAAATVAGHISESALADLKRVLMNEEHPSVIWLQGSGCDGCAISILNSVYYTTIDDVLVNSIDLDFQNNLMTAAGDLAVSAAEDAAAVPGYVLIVEGAIPTGAAGKYCRMWPDTNMTDAVQQFAQNAGFIIALGACATYGGTPSGNPNPTEAKGVDEFLGGDPRVINIPGCPANPDWLIGTVVYLLTQGHKPPLDQHKRPLPYFGRRIHDNCHNNHTHCDDELELAEKLGDTGCMEQLGCKGKHTYSDCFVRGWNSGGTGEFGVNWCIGARSPCLGCVQPQFPDGMSPFYVLLPEEARPAGGGNGKPADLTVEGRDIAAFQQQQPSENP